MAASSTVADAITGAGLERVSLFESGIRRTRGPKGFEYVDELGHIQATGFDAADRKQYRYHAAWRDMRAHAKFDEVAAFGGILAASVLAGLEKPRTGRAMDRAPTAVTTTVAQYLGNTPTIARSAYIDPRVFTTYPRRLDDRTHTCQARHRPGSPPAGDASSGRGRRPRPYPGTLGFQRLALRRLTGNAADA